MFFGGMPGGFPGGFPGGPPGGGRARKPVDNSAYYKLLEVDKSASSADIKKAYRKLAIKHHPDKGGDQELFKQVTKAYEVLSDENKRQLYDQGGEEAVEQGGGMGGSDPSDIFDMVFGGGGRGGGRRGNVKQKGKDVTHPLDVTLNQLYSGHVKKLAINRTVVDPNHPVEDCRECNGKGYVTQVIRMGAMIQQSQQQCSKCNSQGKSFKTKKEREVLEVYVDRGAFHGHKIVFRNKADEQPGQEAGDVQFVLQEKEHPEFKRNKADLTMKKKITLLEALCGLEFELTHLDGRKLLVKTKPGEVIAPQKSSSMTDVPWETFDDTDCPGEDVATCTYKDVNKLKELCESKGFNGFVLDTATNKATFRQLTREHFLSKKKSDKTTKGTRLYVKPDPTLESHGRMRKALKGEGMPLFKNPMLKGNLFVELEIDFPKSISEDAAKQLRAILPGPEPVNYDDDDSYDHAYLTDMDPKTSEKEFASAYEQEDDEEKGGMPGGGAAQNVQCAQQ